MKRESKPHYFQDTILPEETERKGGFDLDREFGPGTKDRLISYLRFQFHQNLEQNQDLSAAWYASYYCSLTSQHLEASEQRERLVVALKEDFSRSFEQGFFLDAVSRAAHYRTLTGQSLETPEEHERMRDALKEFFRASLDQKPSSNSFLVNEACWSASFYRILTGQSLENPKEHKRLLEGLKEDLRKALDQSNTPGLSWDAAYYRLLRAHDIKFIPGKGIEIIDDPPQEFEKKTEPMPEERKF